jgi:glycosyltransferase involved in cell wall biosynthesis
VRRRIIVESLGKAAAVITRSGELARLLSEAGVGAEKLHPVYNGIDFEVFKPGDQAQARRELGLPPEGKLILFVGNFYAIKNPLLLIEAFARLTSLEHPHHLVMIGGGALEGPARALAKANGSPVIFAGRKLAGEVANYMRAADLLCLPSKNEGVPNVILEAFASGLPVLASDVGGIPEVLTHDYLGGLTAPNDLQDLIRCLSETLAKPAQRELIRQHGLQFSWERAAKAYSNLLEQASASSTRSDH